MHCYDGINLDIKGQMTDVFFMMDNIARENFDYFS